MLTLVSGDVGMRSATMTNGGCNGFQPAMGPGWADLLLYQGDDWAAIVRVYLPNNEPAELTGYTARAQIRRASADADPIVAYSFAPVVQMSDIILSVPAASSALLQGSYLWDLELLTPEPDVVTSTILRGNVQVVAEVTR